MTGHEYRSQFQFPDLSMNRPSWMNQTPGQVHGAMPKPADYADTRSWGAAAKSWANEGRAKMAELNAQRNAYHKQRFGEIQSQGLQMQNRFTQPMQQQVNATMAQNPAAAARFTELNGGYNPMAQPYDMRDGSAYRNANRGNALLSALGGY